MAIELKPFAESDWYAFAGAEKPPSGEPCLIGYAQAALDWPTEQAPDGQLIVIVDANGIGVHGLDVWMVKPGSYEKGKTIAAELREPISVIELLAAGWEPQNFPENQADGDLAD